MARAQADPRFATPPLPLERLKLRRRLLREKITGLITAIDALLQDPAPHETDLVAKIYHFHDKQIELRSLDAAIEGHLTGDKLKEDVAESQHFADKMTSCETHALLHPVGKAAINSAAGGYARTTGVSYNRKLVGVPSVPQSTHFVTLPTVPVESLPEQREGLIRDKHAPDARLAMLTLTDVRNAASDDPQPMLRVTDKAEDSLGVRVSVQNDLACMDILPTDRSTVPPSPEIPQSDDPAEAVLPSGLPVPGAPLKQAREGPPSRKEAKQPRDIEMGKTEKRLRAQPRILPAAETTLLENCDDNSQYQNTRQLKPQRKKLAQRRQNHGVVVSDPIPASRRQVCRSQAELILPLVLKFRREIRYRIWRLPVKCQIPHSPKAPPTGNRNPRKWNGSQPATKNSAWRPLFVTATATAICPPTKQCSFRHLLVINTNNELPRQIGFPYDPGGYSKTNGAKHRVLLHITETGECSIRCESSL